MKLVSCCIQPMFTFRNCAWLVIVTICLAPPLSAAPDPPSNPMPPDASIEVVSNPSLCAGVADSMGAPLNVTFYGRDLGATPGEEFEVVVLPDTQHYSYLFPSIFSAQTEWIAENRKAHNIVFVSHVGDVVEVGSIPSQWQNAEAALSLLEDPAITELPEGIPYNIAVGNHDQSPSGRPGTPEEPASTTVRFNEFFGIDRFESKSWYGGHYGDNNDNNFQLFEAGGMKFIGLHLEFNDTGFSPELLEEALVWTEQLLETYADRRAILTSHTLLCNQTACPLTLHSDFSVQGQIVYERLKHHKNLFLMLTGHAGDSSQQPRRTDHFEGGTIHTVLQNYQRGEPCPYPCGNGYFRTYRFVPGQDLIDVTTYSPWLDAYKNGPCADGNSCHDFQLDYDMESGIQFEEIGSLSGVPSGTSACIGWPGRSTGGQYEWFVKVSDGSDVVTSERWAFDSNGSCQLAGDCEDGDLCTHDTCPAGSCSRTPLPLCCETDGDCDDGDYCTDNVCDQMVCASTNNTNFCHDQQPCTLGDVCTDGDCVGTLIACDDGNACTDDQCIDGDCANAYLPLPGCCSVGSQCNDGNRCKDDSCDPGGDCVNTPVAGCCHTLSDCADDGDVCTIETCPPWNAASFHFDGIDDYLEMYQAPVLGLTEFTIEAWFKWDGGGAPMATSGWTWAPFHDQGGIVAYPLVTKGVADQEFGADPWIQNQLSINYFMGISVPDAEHPVPVLAADFEEHPDGSHDWAQNHAVYGVTPILTNQWYHAAMTYDGTCWQLYVNGQPETDGTNCPAEPPAWESRCHFAIGTALDKNGGTLAYVGGEEIHSHFSGFIDEVRAWDHALTATEIAGNMNRAIGAAPGLLSRWGLDALKPDSEFLTVDSTDLYDGVIMGGDFNFSNDRVDLGGGVCQAPVLLPAEVADLVLEQGASTLLSWIPQGGGTTYDIAGGTLSQLHADADLDQAECLAADHADTSYDDERPLPPAGDGYYYLVRAGTTCGGGSYGTDSGGGERLLPGACP